MEHELECDEYCCASCDGERFQCWLCDKLNAAYRRGREDAVEKLLQAVEADADSWWKNHGTHYVGGSEVIGWTSIWGALISASRLGGEASAEENLNTNATAVEDSLRLGGES